MSRAQMFNFGKHLAFGGLASCPLAFDGKESISMLTFPGHVWHLRAGADQSSQLIGAQVGSGDPLQGDCWCWGVMAPTTATMAVILSITFIHHER